MDQIQKILRKEKIESYAHCIRMVVVCYIDMIEEPFPYVVKRSIPLVKEHHYKLQEIFGKPLYQEVVKCAYRDMFVGQDRILGRKKKYKEFFEEYTTAPSSLNLMRIKSIMEPRYLTDIDIMLFEL